MDHRSILLVEDHATTRKLVRVALEHAGFTVHEAKDGQTALALMQAHQPAIVIQDLVLPDVDGFALAARLRGLAGVVPVRLLAFSGLVSNVDAKRISAVGFDDVIAKPIEPSRLVALVEAHVAGLDPAPDQFGSSRRVLVVDDDPIQLHLTAFRLTRLGFEVEEVHDGQQALERAREAPPDLIVSDVLMPRLDGFGLAAALRRERALSTIPIILLTSSYLEASDRELGRRAGADEFVLRTPDLGELALALRTVLSRGKSQAPAPSQPFEELEREHARRIVRQLERQLVHNSELMRRASVLSAELTVLTALSEAVLNHRDVENVLSTALSTCFDAINCTNGALYLLDRHQQLRVRPLVAASRGAAPELERFFGQEAWLRALMQSGGSAVLASAAARDEPARSVLAQARASHAIIVSLMHLGEPLGALFMAMGEGDPRALEQWHSFAHGVGNQIAQGLALAEAFRAREVAEREAEQQSRLAREQAAIWRALVEHAPDVVMQLDRQGRVLFINRAPAGQTPASLRATPWWELMSPEWHAEMRGAFEALLRDGVPRTLETAQRGEAGQAIWIESHLGPIRAGSELVGALVIQRDVSLKKQTEAQLLIADRMASLGTLAAGVAHELNNPLGSVLANLELALQTPPARTAGLPSELLEHLRDARDAAERLRGIVKDLKTFSRLDADDRAPVEVERALESALRMAGNEVRQRATLVKRYRPVPLVLANEARLAQVFVNLIVNAAQAIEPGMPEQNEIRVTLGSDERGWVVVSIADTGSGIHPSLLPRLFTPFLTTKPAGVGTGLGLSICQRIVSALDGTIAVESEPGKGSEFRVAFPPGPEPQARAGAQAIPDSARRGRVLLIHTQVPVFQLVSRALTREHDVFTLEDAREALANVARGDRYDAILCDLASPELSGMDFHRELARACPEQAERIVFFAGDAFPARAQEFLQRVPNPRVERPDEEELRSLIDGLVR